MRSVDKTPQHWNWIKYYVRTTDTFDALPFWPYPIRLCTKKWKLFIIHLFLCQPLFTACVVSMYMWYIWFDATKTRVMQFRLSAFQCRIFHIIIIVTAFVATQWYQTFFFWMSLMFIRAPKTSFNSSSSSSSRNHLFAIISFGQRISYTQNVITNDW